MKNKQIIRVGIVWIALLCIMGTVAALDANSAGAQDMGDYSEDIAAGILGDLGRGVTGLDGEGLYSGRKRQVLLCVINRAETGKLKDIVNSIDPAAFVIMTDTHEVLGEGFKRHQTF